MSVINAVFDRVKAGVRRGEMLIFSGGNRVGRSALNEALMAYVEADVKGTAALLKALRPVIVPIQCGRWWVHPQYAGLTPQQIPRNQRYATRRLARRVLNIPRLDYMGTTTGRITSSQPQPYSIPKKVPVWREIWTS